MSANAYRFTGESGPRRAAEQPRVTPDVAQSLSSEDDEDDEAATVEESALL